MVVQRVVSNRETRQRLLTPGQARSMNESQCTALDGSLIRLSGTEGQFTEPWTSSIVFREGRGLQHFGAGPIDLGERVAAQVMEIPSLDEAYTYQQGELSVGSTEQIDPTVTITRHVLGTIRAGVWRGKELFTVYASLRWNHH